MHGIARHFHRDRPKREPTGQDGIGIRRGFQRGAALRRAANQGEELLAARTQARRIGEEALALEEGARAFDRVTREKGALAAQQPVILRKIRLRRHRDRVQLVNRARSVVLRQCDLRGDDGA